MIVDVGTTLLAPDAFFRILLRHLQSIHNLKLLSYLVERGLDASMEYHLVAVCDN